jgi:hypothetical protein
MAPATNWSSQVRLGPPRASRARLAHAVFSSGNRYLK